MRRKKFKEFLNDTLDITNDVIMDRIFKYFNKVTSDDLDVEEWIVGFSVFLKGKNTVFLALIYLLDQLNQKERLGNKIIRNILKELKRNKSASVLIFTTSMKMATLQGKK